MDDNVELAQPSGDTKVPIIISVLIIATFFSTIVVILRALVRTLMTNSFGKDDWAMVLAQVLNLFSLKLKEYHVLKARLPVLYCRSWYNNRNR